MLTLSDINRLTDSHDGDIYSDLYKDVYGSRPRGAMFDSIEAFDEDFKFLSQQLDQIIIEDRVAKEERWVEFIERLTDIRNLVMDTTWERAIEILADAEGELEDMRVYGYERLEWHFGLKYGSIKNFLAAENLDEEFLQEIL